MGGVDNCPGDALTRRPLIADGAAALHDLCPGAVEGVAQKPCLLGAEGLAGSSGTASGGWSGHETLLRSAERGGFAQLLSLNPHRPRDTVQGKSSQEAKFFNGLWFPSHANSQASRAEILLTYQWLKGQEAELWPGCRKVAKKMAKSVLPTCFFALAQRSLVYLRCLQSMRVAQPSRNSRRSRPKPCAR